MSSKNKQVADMQPATGITTAESNEYQRRWKDERWDRAGKEGNYDRTRDHLNFEVGKGGIIRPIDKTQSVGEKIAARLAQCGIVDPNIGRKTPNIRVCAKFIFGGSRERMHELAFGDQKVDLAKGADNSHITRSKDIEEWAKDIYRFACDEWGEDNLTGFYVHLDETNPHIHCTVLPITKQNRLSFKQVFSGATKWEYRDKMLAFHDRLAVYNRKWGLDRGTNIYETGARHRSTEEYKRELSEECTTLEEKITKHREILSEIDKDIHRARIKQKGLSTMILNLEKSLEELSNKKSELEAAISRGSGDTSQLTAELKKLNEAIASVNGKLEDKKAKLQTADTELQSLREQMAELRNRETELRQESYRAAENIQKQVEYRLSNAVLPDILQEFKSKFSLLNFQSMDLFEGTMLKDLAEQGHHIMQCALLLFAGYVDQATTFAEGCGGGGGGGSHMKWGRDDDEDDQAWARRCMMMAHKMIKPQSNSPQKKRR